MISYSTFMWKNPTDENAVEKAYAKNQVTKVMTFDEFVKHIADHNGVFTRGTVKGVVSDTCSCLIEMLLNGYKVQFGELGIFGISITCEPADSPEKFTANNIKEVNILFTPGEDFDNLRSRAEFKLVASRAAQTATLKAEKSGATIVDLAAAKAGTSAADDDSEDTSSSQPSGTDSQSSGSDSQTSGSQTSGTDTEDGGGDGFQG